MYVYWIFPILYAIMILVRVKKFDLYREVSIVEVIVSYNATMDDNDAAAAKQKWHYTAIDIYDITCL